MSRAQGPLRILRVALGLETAGDLASQRVAGVARGVLSALGARGVGMAASLVLVPLTVRYLGAERYGAWMTIQSLLAWVSIADLGLGSELSNVLARAFGREDARAAREAVATAFWMLLVLSAALVATGAILWPHVSWPQVFNVRTPGAVAEVGTAAFLAFVLFCLTLPLSVVDRVYTSFQEGAKGNAWGIAVNLAVLAAVAVTVRTQGGLPALVAAIMGTTFAVKAVNALWLFGRSKPHLRPGWAEVTRESLQALAARGSEFFFVQIAALVLFSTDNIIIARVLGAAEVTSYDVTWKLLGLTNAPIAAAFPYLWAAHREALARGDSAWTVRTLRRSVQLGTAATALLLLPLIAFGRPLIRVWAGPAATPAFPLVAWMAAWFLIVAPANAVAAFLNAAGKTRVQVWAGGLTAIVNVLLSIVWARAFGPSGVIAATVISYGVVAAVPMGLVALRTTRELRRAATPS